MITFMILGYLFAWLPYACRALIQVYLALDETRQQQTTTTNAAGLPMDDNSIYSFMPSLLAKSSIIYNPIIYAFFNTQVSIW